ncbi:MAG: PIN domain-containing protein [Anaerolineae bacterium]
MKARVVDANVILRFLLDDHPEQSPRSRELLRRVRDGEETVILPEVVVSDIIWTLRSFYHWPAEQIRTFVRSLLTLKGVRGVRREVLLQALDIFTECNVDFSDALIAAEMLWTGQEEIYSYDRDFDRISGLRRLEP